MPQDVLVIHGAGEPRRRAGEVYWKPMIAEALGPDYEVRAPRMPDPDEPRYVPWADRIAQLVSGLEHPFLVGHSFGASTLLKFLAQAHPRPAFRGLFLISTPFWGSDSPEFALTSDQLRRLKTLAPMFFYHSNDDAVVEVAHFHRYQQALPHAVFRLLDDRGHEFDQDSFPELAGDIRSVSGSKEN
jgi:uncharacterized protein